jgi:hypothetical protein
MSHICGVIVDFFYFFDRKALAFEQLDRNEFLSRHLLVLDEINTLKTSQKQIDVIVDDDDTKSLLLPIYEIQIHVCYIKIHTVVEYLYVCVNVPI